MVSNGARKRALVNWTIALLLGSSLVALGSDALEPAPLSPAFEGYLESLRTGEARPLTIDEGQVLGLIPSPITIPESSRPAADTSPAGLVSLPATYDLRTLNRLAPVRNQGGCGSCWAFASYASLESWLLGKGETWDLSENHLKECHGFTSAPCDGGNLSMSAAYVARLSGPVRETDNPYRDYATGCVPGVSPRLWVKDILMVPDLSDSAPLDNAYLKQLVVDYGAVYTTLYWSSAYYRASEYSYYYNGTAWGNHAVAIVGWDDAFSRTRFAFPSPPGDGAWIVRNSWGSSWGQQGYFYVSYYDKRFGEENGVFANTQVPDSVVAYQYDPLGWTRSYGYGSNTAWGAAAFTAGQAGSVVAVATYAAALGTAYEVRIKTSLNGTVLATKTGTFSQPGYHTVPLDVPVALQGGAAFAVVVKYTTPAYAYPIPVEDRILGYTDGATSRAGETYISANGSTWTDLATSSSSSSACIKAFLDPTPPPAPTPPSLVGDFAASDGEDSRSTLTWTNPSDTDLAQVVVLRKTGSFPTSHTDGTTVYTSSSPAPGSAVTAADAGLANGMTYSYAVFGRDTAGAWNDSVQAGKNADTATPSAASPSGPVASWAMNEGTGKVLADATGRGHTGTVTGATWTTSADGSGALSFDGRSDYVRVPTASDLSFGGPFTIEAWIRPASLSGTRALLTKCGTSRQAIYGLWLNGTKLYAEVRNTDRSSGTTLIGTTSLVVETWYHVALRRDAAGTVSLWLNGTQEPGTAIVTGAVNPRQDLYIGRRYGSFTQDFKGRIDEVRIHAQALDPSALHLLPAGATPPTLIADFAASDGEDAQSTLTWTNPADADLAQVVVLRKIGSHPTSHNDGTIVYDSSSPTPGAAVAAVNSGLTNGTAYSYAAFSCDADGAWNDTVQSGENADAGRPALLGGGNGPVAHWRMDEGVGTNTADATGNGHSGTISGASWTTSIDGSGALSFDGVDDGVEVLSASDLDPRSALTVEAWIRATSVSGVHSIVEKASLAESPPCVQYSLEITEKEVRFSITSGATRYSAVSHGVSLSTGRWYHVAGVYDGAVLQVYVNGTLRGTAPAVSSSDACRGNLAIGRSLAGLGGMFRGQIDEVRLHGRALAAPEFNLLPHSWLSSSPTGGELVLERVLVLPSPVRSPARFVAQGEGIEAVRIEVYALSGDRLYTSPWEAGTEHVWEPIGPAGERLARGIYVVVLWARGPDGQEAVTRAAFALFE